MKTLTFYCSISFHSVAKKSKISVVRIIKNIAAVWTRAFEVCAKIAK